MKNEKTIVFEEVKDSAMVKFTVQCTICGVETESEGSFMCGDEEAELDEFQNNLYDDGWRRFHSKEYGQIGLTCGDCIENELNK